MKVSELISDFTIYVTNEERELLKKLTRPIRLSLLPEHDQFRVEGLIRKSLVIKSGFKDPIVVANEKK